MATLAAPKRTYLILAFGLIAASQSGNLVRLGRAPAVVIAAWRLALAALIVVPLARSELRSLRRLSLRQWLLLGLAGAALASHLVAWIAAVQQTTVANAAIFFSVNPVITAVAAHFVFRERMRSGLWLAVGLGLCGIVLIGWNDFDLSRSHWVGDAMALLCAAFFSGYFLLGKALRAVLGTWIYVCVIYGIAAALCFSVVGAFRLPLVDYDPRTWMCFVALALVPTIMGHTSYNHALRHLGAGWIACATLTEAPLAGLVAALAWHELPTGSVLVGYGMISLAVVALVMARQPLSRAAGPQSARGTA